MGMLRGVKETNKQTNTQKQTNAGSKLTNIFEYLKMLAGQTGQDL